jgi:hypothetical protein
METEGVVRENSSRLIAEEICMLSLAEFRASAREVADLGEELQDASLEGMPGIVYVDALFIGRDGNQLFFLLGSDTRLVPDTPRNREELERALYEFGCDEGYCGVEPASEVNSTSLQ